jgi:preprotein translocase subunit SecF
MKHMELIRPGTNIDFINSWRWAFALSGLVILASLASLVMRGGLNYGIDFTGGTLVQIHFKENRAIDEVRSALAGAGLGDVLIQDFTDDFGTATGGGGSEFLIRLPLAGEETADESTRVTKIVESTFGKDNVVIRRLESVGPRVGESLRWQAILTVLVSTVMMSLYIWFRFELRFGLGAWAALAHDVIITVGALSIFNYEIDLTVVAALMTVVGFSVNDTVIISDRIREHMRKSRREPLPKMLNTSINETLSQRSSGCAAGDAGALFLGGNVIHGFPLRFWSFHRRYVLFDLHCDAGGLDVDSEASRRLRPSMGRLWKLQPAPQRRGTLADAVSSLCPPSGDSASTIPRRPPPSSKLG